MRIFDALGVLEEDRETGALLVVGWDIEKVLLVADIGKEVEKGFDSGLLKGLLFAGDIRYHHFVNVAEQVQGILSLQDDSLEDELIRLLVFLD